MCRSASIDGMDFLSDVALAFIAFSTGEFFKLSVLKKNGWKVVWITVLEATLASVLVFVLTFWVLRLPLSFFRGGSRRSPRRRPLPPR